MQGILISLATAAILAIGGAFAAPYVVDWNAWRGSFETEMSKALGLPVVIRGAIDAQILPAPRLVLRDVTLGDVVSTGGTVKELQAELSLGGLMRGDVEATGVTLVHPQMRLVLDSAGEVTLPTGSGEPVDFSIARLEVKDGALDLLDRASDRTLSLTDLDLKGEARSLVGPFRLDGEVEAAGARFGLRSTLGKLGADGTGRLRLILDGRTSPFGVDLDGALGFAGHKPHYDGRAALSRKGSDALQAWQLSGQVRAGPDGAIAENLNLALGGAAMPAQLSGSARVSFGRAIGLDAVLNAKSLDLDALSRSMGSEAGANGGGQAASPTAAFARFIALFADLPAPQAPSKVGLAVDQLMLGGTLVRDAHADISGGPDGWRIDTAEALLPGEADLRLTNVPVRPAAAMSGAGGPAGGEVSGQMLFTADDPTAFLRWAAPDTARDYVAAVKGPVKLAARFAAAPGRIALQDMDGSFAQSRLSGAMTAALTDAGAPKLDLDLTMEGFALDPIIAALRQAAARVGGGADATLALKGKGLTFAGLPVSALSLKASATGGSWRINQLKVDDLGGIHLVGAGWMENFATEPRGELNLTVSGDKADGLVPVARLVAGEETAKVLARLIPVASPVSLTAASVWSQGGGRSITADGSLGDLSGAISFARTSTGVPLSIEVKARATDAGRTLAILGVGGLSPSLGAARGTLTVDPLTNGQSAVKGDLAVAGLTLKGEGTARLTADGTLMPNVSMRLDGADLGRLLPQVAAAVAGPAPAALSFGLSREGPSWELKKLSGSLAGAPITGNLFLVPDTMPRLSGQLAFDALSLPHILGIFGVRAPDKPGAPWSAGRFQPGAVNGIATDFELYADRLRLVGPYVLTGAQLRVRGDGDALEVRDLSGTLGGGHAAGRLTLRPGSDLLHADGHLMLDKVDVAALVGPAEARTAPSGKVSLSLDAGGNGQSVEELVRALVGQGTLKVDGLRVEGATPAALDTVLNETERLQTPPDERRMAQLLDQALAAGPLVLPAAETTFGVVNGLARISPARTVAQDTTITLNGSLDLARLDMEAQIDFEGAEVAGGVPGGVLAWRGPVTQPQRRVGATALTSVVALRAIERETKRLEERRAPSGGPGPAAPITAPRPLTAPTAPLQISPAPPLLPAPPRAPAPPIVRAPVQPPVQAPAPVATPPRQQTPATVAAPVARPLAAPAPAQPTAPQAVRPAPPPPAAIVTLPPPAISAPPQPAKPTPPAPGPSASRGSTPPASHNFGVSTAPATGGSATPAARPSTDTQAPPAARTPPRERTPERETKPATRPAEAARRPPAQSQPRPGERQAPLDVTPDPSAGRTFEPTLPPTRGFGDLPRPPGLVGQ